MVEIHAHGSGSVSLDGAVELVRRYGAAAQLRVVHDGQVVLDRCFGCRSDGLFVIFSAGKPFVAILVHLLAERGLLDLDSPMARYWPEFAHNGKGEITIRHVLQHRSGLPVADSVAGDAVRAVSWQRSVGALQQARPRTPPGQIAAYHLLSYGFLLGELVQRVTGADLPSLLRTELFEPLGMHDTFLGLRSPQWRRRIAVTAPLIGLDAGLRRTLFNSRTFRGAVIPAATVSSTAADLARFYQMLLDGGQLDGVRVLRPETIAQARTPSTRDGEVDAFLRRPMRWSEAFQLGGPLPAPWSPRAMGRLSSPETFGHNGSQACLGWADPTRRLVMVYLTNRLQAGLEGSPHQADVSDAVLAAFS
jgi:CubicO group peptidase (beta-lactamase class C family)